MVKTTATDTSDKDCEQLYQRDVTRTVVGFYAPFSLFSILLQAEEVILFRGKVLYCMRCRERWNKRIQSLWIKIWTK